MLKTLNLFLFLHTYSEKIEQEYDEDDQTYELAKREFEREHNGLVHSDNGKNRKDNAHDAFAGDESGSKQNPAVCAFLLLFVAAFEFLNDKAYCAACHDSGA